MLKFTKESHTTAFVELWVLGSGTSWSKIDLEHVFVFSFFFFNSQDYSYFHVTLFLSATCMLTYWISSTSNTKDRGGTMPRNHVLGPQKDAKKQG